MSPSIEIVKAIQNNIELFKEIHIEVSVFSICMVRCNFYSRPKFQDGIPSNLGEILRGQYQ